MENSLIKTKVDGPAAVGLLAAVSAPPSLCPPASGIPGDTAPGAEPEPEEPEPEPEPLAREPEGPAAEPEGPATGESAIIEDCLDAILEALTNEDVPAVVAAADVVETCTG